MSRRFWIITVLLLLAAAGVGFVLMRGTSTSNPNGNANVPGTNQTASGNLSTNVAANTNATTLSPDEQTQRDLSQIAMSFAERFGSYSNQNNFENIVDLKPFMSVSMQAWADQYVASGRAHPADSSIYYGITTRALTINVKQFASSGPVQIIVSTQRREATGTTSNAKVTYQDLSITFVQEGGVWRVNEAKWL